MPRGKSKSKNANDKKASASTNTSNRKKTGIAYPAVDPLPQQVSRKRPLEEDLFEPYSFYDEPDIPGVSHAQDPKRRRLNDPQYTLWLPPIEQDDPSVIHQSLLSTSDPQFTQSHIVTGQEEDAWMNDRSAFSDRPQKNRPLSYADIPDIAPIRKPDYRMQTDAEGRWVERSEWDFDVDFEDMRRPEPESNDEKIKAAKAEAQQVLSKAADTQELEDELKERHLWDSSSALYELKELDLVDLGKSSARIVGKINPMFELNTTTLEMRGASPTGPAKAEWQSGTVTLDGVETHRVGMKMMATKLDLNTMKGENSKADKDQKKWMNKMPGGSAVRGNYTGGSRIYVRGHLLNDNLGGPANDHNLFPITNDANAQHKSAVEEYIKKGIENGYSYDYNVEITNVSEQTLPTTPAKSHYAVDCDLIFHFGRLTSMGTIAPGTEHKGKVESRFGNDSTTSFTDSTGMYSIADKHIAYNADYDYGMYNHPKLASTEQAGAKGDLPEPSGTKVPGNFQNVLSYPPGQYQNSNLPDIIHGLPPAVAALPAQSINGSANLSGKLSIYNSSRDKVVERFDGNGGKNGLVIGWLTSDIDDWVGQVKDDENKYWTEVQATAEACHLEPPIAKKLFAAGGKGRTNLSIKGA